MSTIGRGYGSEWHLLRWLGYHREGPMAPKRHLDEPVVTLRRRPIADRLAGTLTLGFLIDRKGRIS